METKKPWESKTVWVGILMALAPLIPGASDFMSQNPELVNSLVVTIFMVLRAVSGGRIALK